MAEVNLLSLILGERIACGRRLEDHGRHSARASSSLSARRALCVPCDCLRCVTLLLCNGSNMSLRMTRCRVDSWCSRISHAHSFESDSYLPLVRFLQSWFLRAAGCVRGWCCLCALASACEAKQRSRMEGRSGKRVGVARWRARENAAVCRREREEKTRRAYLLKTCV